MSLNLTDSLLSQIIEHAKEGYPLEACGLLSGAKGQLKRFYPMENAAQSGTKYMMDSRQQLQVMQAIDGDSEEVLGIYHSHVASDAFPSATDVEQAFYPDASYIIVSLQDMDSPQVRSYRIVDGKIEEEPIEMTHSHEEIA